MKATATARSATRAKSVAWYPSAWDSSPGRTPRSTSRSTAAKYLRPVHSAKSAIPA